LTSWTFFAPSPHQPPSHPSHHIPLPWKSGNKHANGGAALQTHLFHSPTAQSDPPPQNQPTSRTRSTGVSLPTLAILDDTPLPAYSDSAPPTKKRASSTLQRKMKLLQGQPSRSLLSSLSAENFQNPIYSHPPMCSSSSPLSISHYCSLLRSVSTTIYVVQFYLRHFTDRFGCSPTPRSPHNLFALSIAGNRLPFCSVDQLTGQALAQYSWPSSLWIPIVRCTTFNSKFAPTPFQRVSLHRRPDTSIASIRRQVCSNRSLPEQFQQTPDKPIQPTVFRSGSFQASQNQTISSNRATSTFEGSLVGSHLDILIFEDSPLSGDVGVWVTTHLS
jgi:hypothetical protein